MYGSNRDQVCLYYQKGECKFGNNCWNRHPAPGGNNVFGGSGTSNVFSRLGPRPSTNTSQPDEIQEFCNQVTAELTPWEKNGMWPLSAFGPLKDHPSAEGFDDTSPEEMRVHAYESLKANNPTAHKNFFASKLEEHNRIVQGYKSQTPGCKEILKKLYQTNLSSNNKPAFGSTPSAFGSSPSSNSLFGNKSTTNNSSTSGGGVFGSSAFQPSSVFGGSSNNTFGQQNSPSAFGASGQSVFGASTGNSQSSTFASNSSSSLFGNQQKGVFGSENKTVFGQQSGSSFGTPTSQNSLFGGNASTSSFGNSTFESSSQSNSVFGGSSQTNTSFGNNSPFGKPSTGSVFGSPQPTSTFGSSFGGNSLGNSGAQPFANQSSLFSNNQNQNSAFGQPSNQSNVFGETSNSNQVFGAASASKPVFGTTSTSNQIFGATSSGNQVFGTSAQLGQTVPFGTPNTSSQLFGGQGNQSGPFANSAQANQPSLPSSQSNQSSLFNTVNQNQPSGFGAPNSETRMASSSFGTSGSTSNALGQAMFPNTQPTATAQSSAFSQGVASAPQNQSRVSRDPTIFSDISQLTHEDLEQYKSDVFTYIPHLPPPVELCSV